VTWWPWSLIVFVRAMCRAPVTVAAVSVCARFPAGFLACRRGGFRPLVAYPDRMAYERITIDPGRMRGLPCIRGTRMTVSAVLGQLAAGRSPEEVLADYPYLERADILAALEFAADAVQDHELPLARPA